MNNDEKLDDLIAAVIERVSELDDPRHVLVDSIGDTDDKDAMDERHEVLEDLRQIAERANYPERPRCPRAERTAFHAALCDYFDAFCTGEGTDLMSDEEMFGALKNGIENIDRAEAAEWLEGRKDVFETVFDKVRRQARASITETIVRVYVPPVQTTARTRTTTQTIARTRTTTETQTVAVAETRTRFPEPMSALELYLSRD